MNLADIQQLIKENPELAGLILGGIGGGAAMPLIRRLMGGRRNKEEGRSAAVLGALGLGTAGLGAGYLYRNRKPKDINVETEQGFASLTPEQQQAVAAVTSNIREPILNTHTGSIAGASIFGTYGLGKGVMNRRLFKNIMETADGPLAAAVTDYNSSSGGKGKLGRTYRDVAKWANKTLDMENPPVEPVHPRMAIPKKPKIGNLWSAVDQARYNSYENNLASYDRIMDERRQAIANYTADKLKYDKQMQDPVNRTISGAKRIDAHVKKFAPGKAKAMRRGVRGSGIGGLLFGAGAGGVAGGLFGGPSTVSNELGKYQAMSNR